MKYDSEHGCAPNECFWPNCKCEFPPQDELMKDARAKGEAKFTVPGVGEFGVSADPIVVDNGDNGVRIWPRK